MTGLDPRALRDAFGSFMTGVTVVTTCDTDGQLFGFTANSFSSVSLDPPLLLVCPGKFLSSYAAFTACSHFAVNILAEGQEEVSNTFASFKGDRFARVAHQRDQHGLPLIDGALAQFSCATRQVMPAGDHSILIGEVLGFAHAEGQGLGYASGQYFSLGLERSALESTGGTAICGAIVEVGDQVLLEKTGGGFRPPQIAAPDRSGLRDALGDALGGLGIEAEIGPAYSVFDDRRSGTHYAYFLASGQVLVQAANVHAVPVCDLPSLSYTTPAIAEMMARYAREARTQSFALYVGDTQSGDVHSLKKGV